ncbi:hypothetical protein GWI33_017549 [Rhynchophorus ferrugineus]|uniref:Uncharacterized protein n=1 Tax=Rhynchophorus ferrugineus TaxID=354439 RepID=A0A834M7J7_RHYFE|nr:hypothetical protein GWI33_017549 [Rhynchophorus ferrugineus]
MKQKRDYINQIYIHQKQRTPRAAATFKQEKHIQDLPLTRDGVSATLKDASADASSSAVPEDDAKTNRLSSGDATNGTVRVAARKITLFRTANYNRGWTIKMPRFYCKFYAPRAGVVDVSTFYAFRFSLCSPNGSNPISSGSSDLRRSTR